MANPTMRDVLQLAFRKVGPGELGTTLDAAVGAEGLQVAQGAYEELVNAGTFGRLTDVITADNYTANENERIRYTGTAVVTIPTTITDALTGDDRAPLDLACVVVTKAGTAPQMSLYDALLGGWVRLDSLTLASDAPLGRRGLDGLASWMALKLCNYHGQEATPSVVRSASTFMAALTGAFGSERKQPDITFF